MRPLIFKLMAIDQCFDEGYSEVVFLEFEMVYIDLGGLPELLHPLQWMFGTSVVCKA